MRFRGERDRLETVIRAGSHEARVTVHRIDLPVYGGQLPTSTWRKPVVGPPARPFAEFQVVDGLEVDGWRAAWVYRPGRFIATWEPRVEVEFPPDALALHDRIRNESGQKFGCWDVFAWRGGDCLFAELKRGGSSDRVRESQLIWRDAALRLGVPPDSFAVVEWMAARLANKRIELTRGPRQAPRAVS